VAIAGAAMAVGRLAIPQSTGRARRGGLQDLLKKSIKWSDIFNFRIAT